MKIGTAILVATLAIFPLSARAAAPDAPHRVLAGLAGTWKVKQSLWLGGATTPKTDTGTADFALVLNGRHLRQTLHIDDGTGFEGLGYLGYDSGAARMFSTWMDVTFPGLVVAYGAADPAGRTYVLTGTMAPSQPDGAPLPVREVMTITDPDHMRYDYYETRGGAEALTVRLDYTRVP